MKLVQFKDGRFGIRRWVVWPIYARFLDLSTVDYWWYSPEHIERWAKGSEDDARDAMKKCKDKHKLRIDKGKVVNQ